MLYLKNATYIDSESLAIKNTHILVNEGIKGEIEFVSSIPEGSQVLDVTGKIVTKSFACGHHHAYSALARGMGAPKKTPENFHDILKYVWWTLDKSLDKDMIRASALATAIASAKAGVTYVIDHHASPFAVNSSLSILAQAFEEVGVSHLLCYEISDRDGIDIAELGLYETEQYLAKNEGLVGLHASFTIGNSTLKKAVELASKFDSGIHVHAAEDVYDQTFTKMKYNKSVVERFDDFGVLNFDKTILAHCLHLSENERNILSKSKAWIAENIESNLNNKVGFFNAKGFEDKVILGTDGMHSDMLRSAKAAFFVGQNFDTIDYPSAYYRFRNVHNYLQKNNFSGDGSNNLVVLDYPSPTPLVSENFLGHFIFGFESSQVRHVLSSGKLIVKDFQIQTVNENEIWKFTKKEATRLWEKMKK